MSLRRKKSLRRLDFGKTSYNHFVLAGNEFLRLVGAPNEFLRLIIILYFQILILDKNKFARVTSEQKYLFKVSI